MYWAALVPLSSTASESQIDQQSLGIWALQFSPRVALVEASVLVEVEASARLFHGMDMLRERIERIGRIEARAYHQRGTGMQRSHQHRGKAKDVGDRNAGKTAIGG